jgi:hypothetical protein
VVQGTAIVVSCLVSHHYGWLEFSWSNNGLATASFPFCNLSTSRWIGLRETLNRKPSIFSWNMGFSCKFSLKPIHWTREWLYIGTAHPGSALQICHELGKPQACAWWSIPLAVWKIRQNGRARSGGKSTEF